MKEIIRTLVRGALDRAVERNLIALPNMESIKIEVSRSKDPRFGDYSTNAAMVLAGPTGLKPRNLAEVIQDNIINTPILASTEIAGPGFINFFLSNTLWYEVLHTIHRQKTDYGCSKKVDGPKILLEFVSANPTGPLHVGHGRGAAVGDTLARLLRSCGYSVHTEYYVNDSGNQMKILGRSLWIRLRQLVGNDVDFPANHYVGEYIIDLAKEIKDTPLGERLLEMPEDEAVEAAAQYACSRILDGIKSDLEYFGVTYDQYFSEKSLIESGALQDTIEEFRRRGRVEEHQGALWFTMDNDEDEKDRVLIRATGEPTYFAADAAYHRDKINRGYELIVDIWGSDHHGYVPRVRAAIEALGYSSKMLQIMLVQFVNLVKEGRKISMSTRAGEFITLREVLDEVGPDAARFFFLTKRSDSHLDFDLDLAKKQSKDNPVYYVQYAHARISSIFRIAAERNIDATMADPDLTALSLPEELKLIKHLGDFPDMLSEAAETLEPHRITFYLMELADLFHAYYHDNRVLNEDEKLKKARLYLVEAVRQVIANGLKILGVTAPERM